MTKDLSRDDRISLARFLDGEGSPGEDRRVAGLLDERADARDYLAALARDDALLQKAPEHLFAVPASRRSWPLLVAAAAVLLVALTAGLLRTAPSSTPRIEGVAVGRVFATTGIVEVERAGAWTLLAAGDTVSAGDRLTTDATGRLELAFLDGARCVLGPAGEMKIAPDAGGLDLNAGTGFFALPETAEGRGAGWRICLPALAMELQPVAPFLGYAFVGSPRRTSPDASPAASLAIHALVGEAEVVSAEDSVSLTAPRSMAVLSEPDADGRMVAARQMLLDWGDEGVGEPLPACHNSLVAHRVAEARITTYGVYALPRLPRWERLATADLLEQGRLIEVHGAPSLDLFVDLHARGILDDPVTLALDAPGEGGYDWRSLDAQGDVLARGADDHVIEVAPSALRPRVRRLLGLGAGHGGALPPETVEISRIRMDEASLQTLMGAPVQIPARVRGRVLEFGSRAKRTPEVLLESVARRLDCQFQVTPRGYALISR